MTNYYFIEDNDFVNAAQRGVRWLVQAGQSVGGGWIAVPQIANIKTIAGYQGMGALGVLSKPPYEGRVNNITLRLITERKLAYGYENLPVLVCFARGDYLDKLHAIPKAKEMAVVPFIKKEIQEWISYSKASPLGRSSVAAPAAPTNGVLYAALDTLSLSVNKSTGLHHPLDRPKAIEIFRILKENGEVFHPTDIKAILVSEFQWTPEYAQDVADVAAGVLAGKHFQLKYGQSFRSGIIEDWRTRAKGSS